VAKCFQAIWTGWFTKLRLRLTVIRILIRRFRIRKISKGRKTALSAVKAFLRKETGKKNNKIKKKIKNNLKSKFKKIFQRMRFGRWFKSFKQIRFRQIWQWKSDETRRWDHLRENKSALLKINESFKAKTIRIDSFTILLNFQKRWQKACRRYGRRIQIERPVQWWVIVPDFYQFFVNPCGESDQLIVNFSFA